MFKSSVYVIFVLLLFMNSAYASQDLKFCISMLNVPARSLEALESKLPKASEQADHYFSRWHKSMDLASFYSLKNRPQYYLWLLRYDLEKAKIEFKSEIEVDESYDARNRIAATSWLFFYFSNLRNSWTEYAAYSGDTSLSDTEKDKISVEMLNLISATNIYSGCLMAQWLKAEK